MTYTLKQGSGPLIVSIPHCGTGLIPGLAGRLTAEALTLSDTDWHLPRLYDFVESLGATMIAATISRYVIDLNRPPDGASLYPGQATTGLCPLTLFNGQPLYRDGENPDEAEIAARRDAYWQPYHTALAAEIARVKAIHGFVLLYDAHSIAGHIPRLFDGRLPDLNFGSVKGASLSPARGARVEAAVRSAEDGGFSHVLNGRFIGGYITRHYGQPGDGVEAMQMELVQETYMDETAPFDYLPERAEKTRRVLRRVVAAFAV